jgi:hypothetical protein
MEDCAMSSTSGKEFEFYARDCMRLADQPNVPPELREQLMQMAREWMKATMEAEDESNQQTDLASKAPHNKLS